MASVSGDTRCFVCRAAIAEDENVCGDCKQVVPPSSIWLGNTQARADKIRGEVTDALMSVVEALIMRGYPEVEALGDVAHYAGRFCGQHFDYLFGGRPEPEEGNDNEEDDARAAGTTDAG